MEHHVRIAPKKNTTNWLVIGKNPKVVNHLAALNWPEVICNSIGLNEAATLFATDYAITGHGKVHKTLIENGIKPNQIIVPLSPFDAVQLYEGNRAMFGDFIRHDWVSDAVDMPFSEMERYVQAAIAKNDIPYPQFWSVLHLAIFYAIKNGAEIITIAGCNHTKGVLHGMLAGADDKNDYLYRHTSLLVDACNENGIQTHWMK